MAWLAGPALALLVGAELAVPSGGPLEAALARLGSGDTLRLGPGEHRGALGRLAGVRVAGAGPGVTFLLVPEGQDGLVAAGAISLSDLTVVAGPNRTALKVLGGRADLARVALVGGAAGAFVDEGQLSGREVFLQGGYGLLLAQGEVRLHDLTASGRLAGLAGLGGTLTVARAVVTGPSREGGISIAGGKARLSEVVIRDPGPSGLVVSNGEVEAADLTVSGAAEQDGMLGDCVQVQRAGLTLGASELTRCGGAALEAARARLRLDGVDAAGGEAGGLVLTDRTSAVLDAILCTGRGPGLVVMGGATVRGFGARFRTDPAIWADCAGGTAVELRGGDPGTGRPCAVARPSGAPAGALPGGWPAAGRPPERPPADTAPRRDPAGSSLDNPRTP